MKFKVAYQKVITSLEIFLSGFVYNFHKRIKGVASKRNLKYVNKGSFQQTLDVFYPKNANSVYNKKDNGLTYPCIVYFHGGGWTTFNKSVYVTLCRRLAKMGFIVYSCNYTLAPKFKMAQIEEDIFKAFNYATKTASVFGGDASKIVLAGDSAGAHLSVELFLKLQNEKSELKNNVKGFGLFYGVYDLQTALTSGFPHIKTLIGAAINGDIKNTQELIKFSPIHADLTGLPPVFMSSGEIDKLHANQSKVFYKKLTESGVIVKTKFYKKAELRAMHAFMNFDGLSTNVDTLKAFEGFLKDTLKLKGETPC